MSEVILQIDDAIPFEQIVTVLAPYIKDAEIKQAAGESKRKIWDGKMDCLQNPWKVDAFIPLKREELYDR
jgi:hypothetical protein